MRVKIFIDFWNFSVNWQERTQEKCDCKILSKELHQHTQHILNESGLGSTSLEETRIYASWEAGKNDNLKK
jgi:hypothetical protein